ncbi:MAG TPA: cytochrome c3 family protein [Thermodesulfobacteriota bacterium]
MLKLITLIAVAVLMAAALQGIIVRECRSAEEGEEAMPGVNPHDWFDSSLCSVCHSGDPPFLQRDPMTTCARCHPGNIGNHPVTRHPLGQVPRIGIPVSLPLTEEGEMVCYTCHEPHGKTRHPHMLRVEYLKLCASCHKGY